MPQHGVYTYELPTSITAPVRGSAGLPVFIGTAPVHRGAGVSAVNTPIVCFSYAEAVERLGYSNDWETWTLCEAMFSQFRLFQVAPAIFIVVNDPRDATPAAPTAFSIANGKIVIDNELIVLSSVTVQADGAAEPAVLNEDYTTALSDGGVTITIVPGGALSGNTSVLVGYDTVNTASVTSQDVIGGIDPATGKRTGIELVEEVFPKARLVPGILAAPGWDEDNAVTQALIAKASRINGFFRAMAVVDIPESAGPSYSDMPLWKETNGLSSEYCIPCWPRITVGDMTFHLSTQLIGLMGRTDADNGDVPFASPSNRALRMDGMKWRDKEIWLDHGQANYLNQNGIVTALNMIGGWKAWGNRTAIYPGNTDPKDMWIPVRRMFNWFQNELILTYWQKLDLPIRSILIDNIVTSVNMRLDGLTSAGALNGGRVEWFAEENPLTNIIDGIVKFHVFMCPPTPAETIEFWVEFDPSYFELMAASL